MPARVINIQDYSLDLEEEVARAADALAAGELVVVPTETVYGIAAKPDIPAAAERLAALRNAATTPLTPHVPDAQAALGYLGDVSATGKRLMQKVWPGPVALMFPVAEERRRQVVREMGVEAGVLFNAQGNIVLRCPDEPLTTTLLRAVGQPVVVTRSGLPGGSDATRAPGEATPEQVSLVLDVGQTRLSKPSTVVRVDGENWEIVREGIYDRRIIERKLRTTVLFICSGNTCRSPMAAALARKIVAEHAGIQQSELADRGFDIVSAGAFAMPGMPATPQAAEVVGEMGAELSTHRSQPLTVELIQRSDVIITMGRAHAQAVTSLVPSASARVLMLDPDKDVDDPIGSDTAHYRKLAGEIEQLLRRRLEETVLKPL